MGLAVNTRAYTPLFKHDIKNAVSELSKHIRILFYCSDSLYGSFEVPDILRDAKNYSAPKNSFECINVPTVGNDGLSWLAQNLEHLRESLQKA